MTKVDDLLKQLEDPALRAKLKERGLSIKQKVNITHKTFIVDTVVLTEFLKVARLKGMKIKDAVGEAMQDFVDKQKKKK
jgi:hypothetical protein